MDRTKQMENVQKVLKELKTKNESSFNKAKEVAKLLMGKHPELQKDEKFAKEFMTLSVLAVMKLGKEKTESIVDGYFNTSHKTKLSSLVEGTSKDEKTPDYLFLMVYSQVERALLAHRVYVLARTSVRDNIEFKSDTPDEDGNMPKHKTMSINLWDADLKKIISLFLVDDQIEEYSKMEQDKAYTMQIGYYNKEKDRWVPSKDPSISNLEDYKIEDDEMEMAKYLLNNYEHLKEPFDEAIAYVKSHPGAKHVMYCRYLKNPNFIQIYLSETAPTISMPYSPMTARLSDNGYMIILGTLQKSKPKDGQPALTDYVIFPEIIIPDESEETDDGSKTDNAVGSTEKPQESNDINDILG